MTLKTTIQSLFLATLLACSLFESPAALAQTSGQTTTIRLARGWNLKSLTGAPPRSIEEVTEEPRLSFWPARSLSAPTTKTPSAQNALRTTEPFAPSGRQDIYWIWSDVARRLTFETQKTVKPNKPLLVQELGWQSISVTRAIRYNRAEVGRVLQWKTNENRYTQLRPGDMLHPGEGYWAHPLRETFAARSETDEADSETKGTFEVKTANRPGAPQELAATHAQKTVRLWWRGPKLFVDGSAIPDVPSEQVGPLSYRIDRDGTPIAEVASTEYQDPVPDLNRVYRYQVAAVWRNAMGHPIESTPSDPVFVDAFEAAPAPLPGAFETPAKMGIQDPRVAAPKTALSSSEGRTYAHVVYLASAPGSAQGPGRERIRYVQSDKAGRPGSFWAPRTLAKAKPGWHLTELTLQAHQNQLTLVWIETLAGAASPRSQVFALESKDGGQSFGQPVLVRDNKHWKRSIDVDYDPEGHHHLIWNEAGKVRYIKNLKGPISSVFDRKVRSPADELVHYQAQYAPSKKGCRCPDCWCEESYILSEEPNPDDDGRPIGPFVHRIEEATVHQPSLYIDDHQIVVVGRQVRMWDNRPVPHLDWARMVEDPVYDPTIIQRLRPTRLVTGWRKTWKHAYEPGDEDLLAGLGFQYQYRYAGTWHEQDHIKVARRPLRNFQEGEWQNNVAQDWQISVLHSDFEDALDDKPSHPQIAATPQGDMIAVFEKGPSTDPNIPGQNPIHIAYSADRGATWSPSRPLARGYVPTLAGASTGDAVILYYAPSEQGASAEIRALQKTAGADFEPPRAISVRPPLPVHPKSHGPHTSPTLTGPSLSAHEELFFAAWVRNDPADPSGVDIVTSRATRVVEPVQLGLRVLNPHPTQKSASVAVTAENKFHMRVHKTGRVRVSGASPQGSGAPKTIELTLENGAAHAVLPKNGRFLTGEGTFDEVKLALANVPADAASPVWAADLTPAAPDPDPLEAFDAAFFESEASTIPGNVSGNYYKAILARHNLLKAEESEEEGPLLYYQVEYEPDVFDEEGRAERARLLDPSLWQTGSYRDAKHLAGFERVWAYTQGIALAQLARQPQSYGPQSRGMAQYLCRHAVRDLGQRRILGWPFSWNTKNDHWKDARLVTGATAWVVHGLGVFIASPAFLGASEETQAEIRACYHQSLEGLKDHQNIVADDQGRSAVLMSAGWSTAGLTRASHPHDIRTSQGQALTGNPQERWAYYTVLDAIGYEEFAPTPIKVCIQSPTANCDGLGTQDPAWQSKEIDQESHWRAMKARVRAENVVTEHNLDVLAVLNSALKQAHKLGPADAQARRAWETELTTWRDRLRDGVFYFLWDDEGWKEEFVEGLQAHNDDLPLRPLTERQAAGLAARQIQMEEALDSGDLGRVITGGTFDSNPTEGLAFSPSPHSAIDNCSWLALSVDYDALKAAPLGKDSEYRTRLATCLRYTVIQYVKELPFGDDGCDPRRASCPIQKTYLGTHYFQNAFRDPYIQPSELQASSYHLEATMGLIMGLNRFARAYPDHPSSPAFIEQAQHLWASAQSFVRDHGFVYSSQRIQDLSAVLASSTAMIWFIDTHDDFERSNNHLDRPIKPYDLISDSRVVSRAYVEQALKRFEDAQATGWVEQEGGLETTWGGRPTTDGPGEPRLISGRVTLPLDANPNAHVVKLSSPMDLEWSTARLPPAVDLTGFQTSPEPAVTDRAYRWYAPINTAHISVSFDRVEEFLRTRVHFVGQVDAEDKDQLLVRIGLLTSPEPGHFEGLKAYGDKTTEWILGIAPLEEDGSFTLSLREEPIKDLLYHSIPVARLIRRQDGAQLAVTSPRPSQPGGHPESFLGQTFVGEKSHFHLHGPTPGEARLVEEAPLFRLRSGLTTRGTPRPYSIVAEQAMAVMVLSNRPEPKLAEPWARELLAMRSFETQHGSSKPDFPYARLLDTHESIDLHWQGIQERMLCHYALAWFLHRNPTSVLKEEILTALRDGINALFIDFFDGNPGPLSGLFRDLDRPVATLENNLIAYFALTLTRKLLVQAGEDVPWHPELEALTLRLQEMCGMGSDAPPTSFVSEGEGRYHSGEGVHKDCALFAWHTGDHQDAARLLDRSAHLTDADDAYGRPTPKPVALWAPKGSPLADREAPEESPLGTRDASTYWFHWFRLRALLAHRALAPLDPRQAQIASVDYVDYDNVPRSPRRTQVDLPDALTALLFDNPQGIFGVFAPPATDVQTDGIHQPRVLDEHLGRVKNELANRSLDVVSMLLSSSFTEHRFDAILAEWIALEIVHQRIAAEGPDYTVDETLRAFEHTVSQNLCDPNLLVHQASFTFAEVLGMDCKAAQPIVRRLFKARGSLGEGTWTTTFRGDLSPGRLHDLVHAVVHPPSQDKGLMSGDTELGALGLAAAPPLSLPSAPSVAEVQDGLRQRLTQAIERALESAVTDTPPVHFALDGMDPIEVFHASSPTYWARSAVELRAVLSPAYREKVVFTVEGKPTAAPAFPLDPIHSKNVRLFRRWLNTLAGGDLQRLADDARVYPSRHARWLTMLHRILRTGVFPRARFEALTEALEINTRGPVTPKFHLEEGPFSHPESAPADAVAERPQPDVGQDFFHRVVHLGERTTDERDHVVEAGAGKVILKSKAPSRLTKTALRALDELLTLPSGVAVTAVAMAHGAGYLTTAEVDIGLETILIGGTPPPEGHWSEVGVVVAQDLLEPPLEAYLKDEDNIRNQVPIYPSLRSIDEIAQAPKQAFDDTRVYYIQVERWAGNESPLADYQPLNPSPGTLWKVFALNTERSRHDLWEAFLNNHPVWKQPAIAPITEALPPEIQPGWDALVKSAFIDGLTLEALQGELERDNGPVTERVVAIGAQSTGGNLDPIEFEYQGYDATRGAMSLRASRALTTDDMLLFFCATDPNHLKDENVRTWIFSILRSHNPSHVLGPIVLASQKDDSGNKKSKNQHLPIFDQIGPIALNKDLYCKHVLVPRSQWVPLASVFTLLAMRASGIDVLTWLDEVPHNLYLTVFGDPRATTKLVKRVLAITGTPSLKQVPHDELRRILFDLTQGITLEKLDVLPATTISEAFRIPVSHRNVKAVWDDKRKRVVITLDKIPEGPIQVFGYLKRGDAIVDFHPLKVPSEDNEYLPDWDEGVLGEEIIVPLRSKRLLDSIDSGLQNERLFVRIESTGADGVLTEEAHVETKSRLSSK